MSRQRVATTLWAQLSEGGTIVDSVACVRDAERLAGYAGFVVIDGPADGLWLISGPNTFDISWHGGPEDATLIVARDPHYLPDFERETVHMRPDQ